MSVESALAAGRRAAEARMTSRSTVKRPGEPVEVNGLEVDGWTAVHTGLPGRLSGARGGTGGTRAVTIGQTELQLAIREWHCPASTTDLRDGDVIEITHGENTGLFVRVVETAWQDQATARRLPVVEIQKPEGWDT